MDNGREQPLASGDFLDSVPVGTTATGGLPRASRWDNTDVCRFRLRCSLCLASTLDAVLLFVVCRCASLHGSLLWAVSSSLLLLSSSLSTAASSGVASYAQVPSANARVEEYVGAGCAQAFNTYYSLPRGVCVGQSLSHSANSGSTATQRQPQPHALQAHWQRRHRR